MRALAKRISRYLSLALATVFLQGAKPSDLPAQSEYVTGRLLVAVPKLPDSRFRNTIILMVDHNKDGAIGLIVNKPIGFAEFEV